MNILWKNVAQDLIPLLIMGCFAGIAKIIYDYRKNLSLLLKRWKLNLLPLKFNVALSLDSNNGLNSGTYYQEILKELKKVITENRLSKLIIVKDFSDIKKFSSEKEAEDFIKKKNLDLIIWGGFSEDGLKKDGENFHKIDLKFTYKYPDDGQKKIGSMLLADVGSKLAIKNYWQILEKNSFSDLEIITNNLFDLATYILGTTLKLSGRINTSLKLFESLFNKLNLHNDNFLKQVIPHLLNCYEIFIIDLGINKKKYDQGVTYCKKYLKILPNNAFALSNLAYFQFNLGDEKEAGNTAETLLKTHPYLATTELDISFFRILQKNYKNAYKHYQKLSKFNLVEFNPQEVIEFLFNQYEIKKEPALLYGAGFITYYFGGDRILAKRTFKQYLSLTSEKTCKLMYRNAKKLMEKSEN